MTINTVVVAVGDEDQERTAPLAEAAIEIAGPSGATVRLFHVFERDEYQDRKRKLEFGPDSEATPDTVAKRHVTIRDLGDALDEAGVAFTWNGVIGDRAEAVVDFAEDVGADRIIVGGRKRTPAGKALFGSTAQEIMLESPCPVTFVRVDDGEEK
jgi:nucleotide-binding universal stress UspA family protein